MGSNSNFQIPIIQFPIGSEDKGRGTVESQSLCKRVRDACENFGCFEAVYDKISSNLCEETFSSVSQLFYLPLETKEKSVNSKPYHDYYPPGLISPLFESIGLEDASNSDKVKTFTDLMWPDGNYHFRQSINSMMKQVEALSQLIGMIIMDSYGLGGKPESFMEHYILLRVMKYGAPRSGRSSNLLSAHTDKVLFTLLWENQISGLEILTKDGKWVKVFPSPGSFVFVVADGLMAWSNGRMHSPLHRVMMSGDKDRYSFGAFVVPVEGTIIRAPKELIDEEHPQVFKDFNHMEFLKHSFSGILRPFHSAKQVFIYAGLTKN